MLGPVMEETLVWRLEVLGRWRREPDLPGRFAGPGPPPLPIRPPPLVCAVVVGAFPAMLSAGRPWGSPRILPWPVGEGKAVNLNSVEADSMLLWRSSKFTEGRKSYEPVVSAVSCAAPFPPPNENKGWVFEDVEALSIGPFFEGSLTGETVLGMGAGLRL